MISSNAIVTETYDYPFVTLSIWIGTFASYSALHLAGRVTLAPSWARSARLAGGATAMGFGIGPMHFAGMLAVSFPVLVEA